MQNMILQKPFNLKKQQQYMFQIIEREQFLVTIIMLLSAIFSFLGKQTRTIESSPF